jgi:autotransporter-associated beta strand protein
LRARQRGRGQKAVISAQANLDKQENKEKTMKGNISLRAVLVLAVAVAMFGLAASPAGAVSLTWDANGTGDGLTDGGGIWLDPDQWWDGAANATWSNANPEDASIGNGGAGGTITLGTVTAGSLTFNSFTDTYTLSGGILTLNSGLTMNLGAGAVTIVSPVTLGGPQSWTNNSAGLLTVQTGAVTNGGNLLTIDGSADTTISSVIGGAGGITKTGAGTLTLTGANTHTGLTTVSAGVLRLEGPAFATAPRNYYIASGAVLNVHDPDNVPVGTSSVTGTGTLRITGGFWCEGGSRLITIALGSGGLIDVPAGSTMWNGGWWTATWTSNLSDLNVDGTFNIWDGHNPFIDALTGAGTVLRGHGKVGPDSPVTILTLGVDNGSGTFSGNFILGYYGTPLNVVKTGSGTQVLTGTSSNYKGELSVTAGTLVVGGAGAFTAINGITVNGPTAVFMQNSSVPNDRTFTLTQGTLGGTGTITTAITSGPDVTIAPGDRTLAIPAAGTLNIANAVDLTGGTTEMRLFSATESDTLAQSTTGGLTYGGILKVIDLNPTDFAVGNNWDLFDFDSQSGTFSNNSEFGTVGGINLPLLAAGQKWSFDYGNGVLSVVLGLLTGDADENGVVDAADYIALKSNFGMTSGALWKDGNFSDTYGTPGTVDYADLQILMANFSTRSVGEAPAVPEPGSVMLLMFGAAALLRRRRK